MRHDQIADSAAALPADAPMTTAILPAKSLVRRACLRLDRRRITEACVALVVTVYYVRHFALRLADPDLWGRLAIGRLIFAAGTLPRSDPFAYTPTLPLWIDHEWLTGVVFYCLYTACGDVGLLIAKTSLGLATVLLVWRIARLNRAARLPLLVALAVTMPVFGYGMTPRAQLFTYLFFALWLYVLERFRHGGSARMLAILPVTIVPWANLHGGFLAGLGLLALYAVGMLAIRRRAAALTGVLALCGALTLINPYGLDYWRYLVPAVLMHRPEIREWAPVPWSLDYTQFWFLSLFSLTGAWLLCRDGWRSFAPALALAVTFALAARHARHMPLLAICGLGLATGAWFPNMEIAQRGSRQLAGLADFLLHGLLLATAMFQLYGLTVLDGPPRLEAPQVATGVENGVVYPVGAVNYAIEHHLKGNLAVPFNWGEYAIWYLYPDCRVSLDGRYETAYPPQTVALVDRFYSGRPGWADLIDHFATDYALVPAGSTTNQRLGLRRDWQVVYADQVAVLWGRR
jgi:hypothetical protein